MNSRRRFSRLFAATLMLFTCSLAVSRSQPAGTARGIKPAAGRSAKTVPAYRCEGFADPFEKGPVTINRGRTLPLRANLFDAKKTLIGASALKAKPELRVVMKPRKGKESDVTDAVEARDFGQGVHFAYKEEYWKFDVGTDGLTDAADYEFTLVSGSEAEYRVDPPCRVLVTLK